MGFGSQPDLREPRIGVIIGREFTEARARNRGNPGAQGWDESSRRIRAWRTFLSRFRWVSRGPPFELFAGHRG